MNSQLNSEFLKTSADKTGGMCRSGYERWKWENDMFEIDTLADCVLTALIVCSVYISVRMCVCLHACVSIYLFSILSLQRIRSAMQQAGNKVGPGARQQSNCVPISVLMLWLYELTSEATLGELHSLILKSLTVRHFRYTAQI